MSKKSVVLISIIIFLPLVGFGAYLYIEQKALPKFPTGPINNNEAQTETVDSSVAAIRQDSDMIESINSITSSTTAVTSVKTTTTSKLTIPSDWATVSSKQGFSFGYPYKEVGAMWGDDGVFEVSIFFPSSVTVLDASTAENLSDDIHNIGLYAGVSILVIENNIAGVDFKSWIQSYTKKEYSEYGKKEVILSEKISPKNFAGIEGYQVTLVVKGPEEQGSPHYIRKETFISKGKFIYQISTLAASDDTTFPRSGLVGRKYLQRVDELSQKILGSFVFNSSTKTALIIPKISAPKLSGENARLQENLLATLRTEPFFGTDKTYDVSSNACVLDRGGTMESSTGIYISVDMDKAGIHAYDNNGGHTGTLPKIPGTDWQAFSEEKVYGVAYDKFGGSEILSIQKNVEGRIELVGKEYGWANFTMRGEGNSCEIMSTFIPVTPYSVGTLKMDTQGNIGPISYDIDGDGKQDFVISLKYPLLQDKNTLINNVIDNMKSVQ